MVNIIGSLNFKISRLKNSRDLCVSKVILLILLTDYDSASQTGNLCLIHSIHARRTRTYLWNGHNLLTAADRTRSTYLSPRSSVQSLHRRRSTMILARGWKLIRIEGNGWGNLATADCLKWRMVPSGTSLKIFSDTYLDAPWCCNAVAVIVWDTTVVA